MGLTPTHELPYPEPLEPPNVPADMQELATAVDRELEEVVVVNTQQTAELVSLDGRVDALEASGGAGGDLIKIQTIVLAADAASFDFQAIPATYESLQLLAHVRATDAAVTQSARLRFNNDIGAVYDWQSLVGAAGAVAAGNANLVTSITLPRVASAGAVAGAFGVLRLDIPGYLSAAFKQVLAQGGYINNAAGTVFDAATGQWRSAVAINRLTLFPNAGMWFAGSRATLYGLT